MDDYKDFVISICSVGEWFHPHTSKLIEDIRKRTNVPIIVMTDKSSMFSQFKYVRTVVYSEPEFNYHDKIKLFEEGLRDADTVIALDADHIFDPLRGYELDKFSADSIVSGIYPRLTFEGDLHPGSMNNFFSGNIPWVPYGPKFMEFCDSENIDYCGASFFHESWIMLKRHPKTEVFLDTWRRLRPLCDKLDIRYKDRLRGVGEGYSIGVAANHAKLPVFSLGISVSPMGFPIFPTDETCGYLGELFLHARYTSKVGKP